MYLSIKNRYIIISSGDKVKVTFYICIFEFLKYPVRVTEDI